LIGMLQIENQDDETVRPKRYYFFNF